MPFLRARWNIYFGFIGFLQIALYLGGLQAAAKTLPMEVPVAQVVSIEGAQSLEVQKANVGRQVQAGSPLENGDKITTPGQTAVVIKYADGSTLTVGPDSEFQIEDHIDGTQWNRLKSGMVRGLITKPPIPISKAKFLIRTRAAVLGVRGTDFVMALDSLTNTAQVHTLEGSVEVALNEEALLRGNGTIVGDGKFIDAGSGKLEVPESFNKKEFLKSFEAGMPSPGEAKILKTGGGAENGPIAISNGLVKPGFTKPSISLETAPQTTLGLMPPLLEKSDANEKPSHEEKPLLSENLKESQGPNRFRIINFRLGAFFSVLPKGTIVRAVSLAWTPTLPVPFLSFLTIRGNLGLNFARDGSLSGGLLVNEYQVFLNLNLLQVFFVEAGIGRQVWNSVLPIQDELRSFNAGILLPSGILKSIYFGYQYLNTGVRFDQFKAGVEIFLF
ncbi:MAG: FecR family protein [Bdellovibrionia bacterium]